MFKAEELKAIAERVYQGREMAFSRYGDEGRLLVSGVGHFKPSLTGSIQERAQALDCIVAAYKMTDDIYIDRSGDKYHVIWKNTAGKYVAEANHPDILTALVCRSETQQ